MNRTLIAAQLLAVRASLVAGLEQCDAMMEALKLPDAAPTPPSPPASNKKRLEEGEQLLTFGGGKAHTPKPQ